ncbi:MAG: FAD-dependent oxidoreductase [Clostridiales bacterium]|jgi:2,4-dienoyl-CoA reductase-like NADH-dependent reductase (Old Yellow Enzyme family)/NADPH-dependent 2,4-dienoyl-CoA reductase/sulfur reductase-like enzyme|nr:FAD-dependent oxidoreductase [Clostridiales bacterium]
MYPHLSSKCKIGNLEIKNRLVMSPVDIGIAEFDGAPGPEMIEFYEERARGGAGIIIPGIARVNEETGIGEPRQIAVTKDSHIEPLSKLAAAVHKHGSKLFIQLQHPGRQSSTLLTGGKPLVAPSAIMGIVQEETRALEADEIKEIIKQFVDGAVRVQKAGCDGVELHGAHGYLINQFLSPFSNKRTDEYGGNYKNRLRFAAEIVKGIRETCGSDFVLGIRLTADEGLSKAGISQDCITIDVAIRMAADFERLGVDFIDVTHGTYETMNWVAEPVSYPQGNRRDIIQAVKNAVKIPIIGVGLFREPEVAEQFLKEGVLDFASSGRSWLADSEWGVKALLGREKEIRKCISCLHCFDTIIKNCAIGQPLECAVNPRCARETAYGDVPHVADHRKAVVVGAGPAGLSAACTLAERGVDVTLLERSDRIGGQVIIGKNPPLKDKMQWFMCYYEYRMQKLGVNVQLNTEATPSVIDSLAPAAVVVATGGQAIAPAGIPGIGNSNVYGVEDVLGKRIDLRDKKVAVIGAGMTGIETAEYLANKGNAVAIVEMQGSIAPEAYPPIVQDVMSRLMTYAPEILLGHALKEIGGDGIVVEEIASKRLKTVPVDAVVLSLGYKPVHPLADALTGKNYLVQVVGDASKVGKIGNAVRAGFECGRSIL